jgi:hypothetical protein
MNNNPLPFICTLLNKMCRDQHRTRYEELYLLLKNMSDDQICSGHESLKFMTGPEQFLSLFYILSPPYFLSSFNISSCTSKKSFSRIADFMTETIPHLLYRLSNILAITSPPLVSSHSAPSAPHQPSSQRPCDHNNVPSPTLRA